MQRTADFAPGVKGGIILKIIHKISMDLDRYTVPGFDAVCGDRNTRELEIALYAGGTEWMVPEGTGVSVRYRKPDGTGGSYDLLPNGTTAWEISGNRVTVAMAPQTMTVPGCVILTVCLAAGEREISTFQILMNVRPAVGWEPADSGDYWYRSDCLPQPEKAQVGQVLVVESVDSSGRVTGLTTAAGAGLTGAQINALEALLKLAAYTENPTDAFKAFRSAFGQQIQATGVALSAATLELSAGTAKQLTATVVPENATDPVVWTSSNEAVATVVDGLVTPVGNGKCTITATAGSVSASCTVTVSGVGEQTHTHSYTAAVTAEPTCTETGTRTYTCYCGESYTESIPATGHNYVNGVCSKCGASDPDYEEPVTLTGISVNYTGGSVPVGTKVSQLSGVHVTAQYSDGSISVVTDYTLFGVISEGTNTIEVRYGGFTATFTVTGTQQFYDVEWVEQKGYYKNGVLTSHDSVRNTGLIAVGDAAKLKFYYGRDMSCYIAFFDSTETYVSQVNGYWTANNSPMLFDIPENAVYFCPAYFIEDVSNVKVQVNANQVRHLITTDLSNVTINTKVTNVIDGSVLSTTLTAANGYNIDFASVQVTMGGVDISNAAVTEADICIEHVTGDVVITAKGVA